MFDLLELGHAEISNRFEALFTYATQYADNADVAQMLMDFYYSCHVEYLATGRHSTLSLDLLLKYWDRFCKPVYQ